MHYGSKHRGSVFRLPNQNTFKFLAIRKVHQETIENSDLESLKSLEAQCKSYHPYAIAAEFSHDTNNYHQCFDPPDNISGFCGYPWDPDPYSDIPNKSRLICSSTQQREVCLHSSYHIECHLLGDKCAWEIDRCIPDSQSVCENQSTRESCENTTLEGRQCSSRIVSAEGSADVFGSEIYQSLECSVLNSHDCVKFSKAHSCVWHEPKAVPYVSHLNFNQCCRIPSLWCENIGKTYTFDKILLSVGMLTCEDAVGPTSSLDRSSVGYLASQIDIRCCTSLADYTKRGSVEPSVIPSHVQHSLAPFNLQKKASSKPTSRYPSLSHSAASSKPSHTPTNLSYRSGSPSLLPNKLPINLTKTSEDESPSPAPEEPMLLVSAERLKPSNAPTRQPSNSPLFFPSTDPTSRYIGSLKPSSIENISVYSSKATFHPIRPSNNPSESNKPDGIPSMPPTTRPIDVPSSRVGQFPSEEKAEVSFFHASFSPSLDPTRYFSSVPSNLPSEIATQAPSKITPDPTQFIEANNPSSHPSQSPSNIAHVNPTVLTKPPGPATANQNGTNSQHPTTKDLQSPSREIFPLFSNSPSSEYKNNQSIRQPSEQMIPTRNTSVDGSVKVESISVYSENESSNKVVTSAIIPLFLVAGLGMIFARRIFNRTRSNGKIEEDVDPSQFEHVSPYESAHHGSDERIKDGVPSQIEIAHRTSSSSSGNSSGGNIMTVLDHSGLNHKLLLRKESTSKFDHVQP